MHYNDVPGAPLILIAAIWFTTAHAHPDVATHLHVPPPPCSDGGDDPSRIRRAGVLADAGRFEEAFEELDATCQPKAEVVRLARARTALKSQDPHQALLALEGLSGPDAALWRGQALAELGRHQEASVQLAQALASVPDAPPQAYLDASAALPAAQALAILELGMERLGNVGALRRAAATCEAEQGQVDQAAARLTHPTDGLLKGDLLHAAGRDLEARQAWQATLDSLALSRPTPANSEARKTLLQRMDAL